MIASSSAPWGGVTGLDNNTDVHRAILSRSWFDRAGKIQFQAFLLRLEDNERDLSVTNPAACSPARLCGAFRTCFGVLRLNVGSVRSLALDVLPDSGPGPHGCNHGRITGLPTTEAERDEAERFARQLARSAIVEWWKP